MSGFTMSLQLLFSKEFQDILALNDARAGIGMLRQRIFIIILAGSADGMDYFSVEHLSNMYALSYRQALVVWKYCDENKILRKHGSGFSALEWMTERGIVHQEVKRTLEKKVKEPELEKEEEQTPEEQSAETEEQPTVPASSETMNLSPTQKFEVRSGSNVTMTAYEFESFKREFTPDEQERIIDKLSAYKKRTGKNYNSDYDAVHRWVYKSIKQQPQTQGNDAWFNDDDFIARISGKAK